ncbi:hypothetical protein [Leptolyngbya sp. NIES-2104]|uniref:hypothetical protein n=1 Tax=Leptolyngbya sp. NIES-2104 TaxID=1552121 RepID=UPI000A8C8D97|nr:hypothetical protein [Leptolyngbya sp. NIES-2104]
MAALYIQYRITAWQTVNRLIAHAEQTTQTQLDDASRRVAKGVVVNWLIEKTHLPVDLIPETVSMQDSFQALRTVMQLDRDYFAV